MTIEVRQMLIKSTVEDENSDKGSDAGSCLSAEEREAMKQEVLAECIEHLTDKRREERER